MSAAREILGDLRDRGVRVWLSDGGSVRVNPPDRIPAASLAIARAEKHDVAALLRAEARALELGLPNLWELAAPAIALKHQLRWSDGRFQQLNRRLLGRPGPATAAEDEFVALAMLDEPVTQLPRPVPWQARFETPEPSLPDVAAPWNTPIPPDTRERANHVNACARHAGIGVEDLFALIDQLWPQRPGGPFSLTKAEAADLVVEIRTRHEEGHPMTNVASRRVHDVDSEPDDPRSGRGRK